MPDTASDLSNFREYVECQLRAGNCSRSLDEFFDEWRLLHPSEETVRESILAVASSLRDLDHGASGIEANTLLRELKSKYGTTE